MKEKKKTCVCVFLEIREERVACRQPHALSSEGGFLKSTGSCDFVCEAKKQKKKADRGDS